MAAIMQVSQPAEPSFKTRYYFHLVSSTGRITDDEGVEAASLNQAKSQALMAIDELRAEEDTIDDDWIGWRLEVTDPSGDLVMVFDLGHSFS